MSLSDRFPGRPAVVESLEKDSWCDLLVIGGGIHGATVAHLSAFNGLKTVLLEQADYAAGTSSRSSKLIHGGLRYLEKLDVAQVYRGIRARTDWLKVAPHLVRTQQFAMPIPQGESIFKAQLACGMALYKALSGHFPRIPPWVPRDAMNIPLGNQFAGAYLYNDGIMNDARLVIERITAARQEGARCLNYARVEKLVRVKNGRVRAFWRETNEKKGEGVKELEAGIVLNCAGPWAGDFGTFPEFEQRFSRGSHILFDIPWTGPALIIPFLDGKKHRKGRYYFVLPHPAGTLVGTTEREVNSKPELDPLPDKSEIEELFLHLKQDLPESGLDMHSAHYCFAGIRSLIAGKSSGKDTSQLTRSHRWVYRNGILTLLGGKFTTASQAAFDGLSKAFTYTEAPRKIVSLKNRLLPGSANLEEATRSFRALAIKNGIPEPHTAMAIARFGAWVRYFEEHPAWWQPLKENVLLGELGIAVQIEQAETLEDILRRRLGLEYYPDHGMQLIADCQKILHIQNAQSEDKAVLEKEFYSARMGKIKALLGSSSS